MTRLLNSILHQGPEGLPLLIVHGLYGSARNWGVIAKRLSTERPVVAVDMRNHGASFHHPDHNYHALAYDLARTIEQLGGQADVLGHSMGGKAAMVLALKQPDLVNRLIVADIAPVGYFHDQVQFVRAMRSVPLDRIERRSDADAALADLVDEASLRSFFLQSLEIAPDGARWRLNLDALEAEMPKIIDFPDLDGSFEGAARFIIGAKSDYVRAEHRDKVVRLFPNASHEVIPDAGHWLHAEKPREFTRAVARFLAE